jgi:hypothetical protein
MESLSEVGMIVNQPDEMAVTFEGIYLGLGLENNSHSRNTSPNRLQLHPRNHGRRR